MPRTVSIFKPYYPCLQILLYLIVQSIPLNNIFVLGEGGALLVANSLQESISTTASPQLKDRDLYLKGFSGSLSAYHLEYMLDSYDEHLMKEYEFDPSVVVNNLIGVAQSHNTTPEQFQEEMKEMLDFNKCVPDRVEEELIFGRRKSDVCRRFCKSSLNESCVPLLDTEERKPSTLEIKYNVTSEPRNSTSVTHARLVIMFPHHRLFAVLHPLRPYIYTFGGDDRLTMNNIFEPTEFGGLIPRSGTLKDEVRRALIAVHLHLTHYKRDVTKFVPFRSQCLLLKWRIEKSLLSDERRVRLLQNYEVIDEDRELRAYVKEAYAKLSDDFRNSIFWEFLK